MNTKYKLHVENILNEIFAFSHLEVNNFPII